MLIGPHQPSSRYRTFSTLILTSFRRATLPINQARRVSGNTFIVASFKEKAKEKARGAVLAATEKFDMAHRLQHRREEKDLRGQAKAGGLDDITPVSRKGSLPWEKELLEPSLKNVKLVDRKPRRLIVACDGTWVNSHSDVPPSPSGIKKYVPSIFSTTHVTLPSNITRLCRALNTSALASSTKEPQNVQVIYYHNGLGTDGGLVDKLVGGATGATISDHIKECYSFLCNNWQPGDEIFLFGFSRGAYTARAISTLINDVGLLTAKGMEYFGQIFQDWKDQNLPENLTEKEREEKNGARGAFLGMARTPPMPSQRYVDALVARGLTRDCYDDQIIVKALGVFDTVGALGVPPVFGINLSPEELIQYSFVNTKVSNVVEHAIQALALDDHRAAFQPAVWEQPDLTPNDGYPKNDPKLKTLDQVWFPGVHSSIGGAGGYEDQSIANETLAWMVSKLQIPRPDGPAKGEPLLDFDIDYLHWVFELNVDHCNLNEAVGGYRGWALGKIEETLDLKYKFIGDVKPWQGWENWNDWKHPGDLARTPGRYTSCEARGGRKHNKHTPLVGSNEKIHPSARVRLARGGKGLDDQGAYFPKGLEGFRLVTLEGADQRDPQARGYKWIGTGVNGEPITIEEEVLGGLERELIIASAMAMAEKAAGVPVVDSRFEQPKIVGQQAQAPANSAVPAVREPVPPQAPAAKGPLEIVREVRPGPVSGKSG